MTHEEKTQIAIDINNAIAAYDHYRLMELAKSNDFAMYYIIQKLLSNQEQLDHIKNILK